MAVRVAQGASVLTQAAGEAVAPHTERGLRQGEKRRGLTLKHMKLEAGKKRRPQGARRQTRTVRQSERPMEKVFLEGGSHLLRQTNMNSGPVSGLGPVEGAGASAERR